MVAKRERFESPLTELLERLGSLRAGLHEPISGGDEARVGVGTDNRHILPITALQFRPSNHEHH